MTIAGMVAYAEPLMVILAVPAPERAKWLVLQLKTLLPPKL